MNLYQVLGLEKTATPAQIKKAYRRVTAEHHPDKHTGDAKTAAEEVFKQAAFAYEVLSDPERRAWYDEFGPESFERGFNPELARAARRSAGPGSVFGRPTDPNRNSLDDIMGLFVTMMGETQSVAIPFLVALRGGALKLPSGRTVSNVPAGIQTGDLLEYKVGNQAKTLSVFVQEHPVFSREGTNVLRKYNLTLAQAYLGSPVTIESPWGMVHVKVPQGIRHGERFRVKGHGVRLKDQPKGDMLVEVYVIYPPAGDPKLTDALARLQGNGT